MEPGAEVRLAVGCCVLAREARFPRLDAFWCWVDDITDIRLDVGLTSDCGGCVCVCVCV